MEYDYVETSSTPSLFKEKMGVREHPDRNIPKPYSFTKVEKQASFGLLAYQYKDYPLQYFQLDWSNNSADYVALNNMHTRRVRGKVEGIQHFAEALVEFKGLQRQLWSLLHQGLRTITRHKGSFKARDIFARGTWKQTPELYLLWQFAIAPLVSQINDTIEKLGKVGGTYYDRVSTGGDCSSGDRFRSAPAPTAGPTPKNGTARFTTVFKYTVDNNIKAVATEFLGLNRPLTALWDLKGWSWAVDYFFNVGELLANLDGDSLTRKVEFLSHSVKLKVDVCDFRRKMLLGTTAAIATWKPGVFDRTVKSWKERFGVSYLHTDAQNKVWLCTSTEPETIARCLSFVRTTGSFPNAFYPEFRFKPKPGSFQFANLASAIAITLRSFEWSDKNFLIKPHKR